MAECDRMDEDGSITGNLKCQPRLKNPALEASGILQVCFSFRAVVLSLVHVYGEVVVGDKHSRCERLQSDTRQTVVSDRN